MWVVVSLSVPGQRACLVNHPHSLKSEEVGVVQAEGELTSNHRMNGTEFANEVGLKELGRECQPSVMGEASVERFADPDAVGVISHAARHEMCPIL